MKHKFVIFFPCPLLNGVGRHIAVKSITILYYIVHVSRMLWPTRTGRFVDELARLMTYEHMT